MMDETAWFNSDTPDGAYTLDLSNVYDRAVLVDVLHMAATNDAVRLRKVKYIRREESGGVFERNLVLEVGEEVSEATSIETYLCSWRNLQMTFNRWVERYQRRRWWWWWW